MIGLKGEKIGIAASRKADEIATLVQKNGGTPAVFPIQGEQQLNANICEQNVKELLDKSYDVVLLTTGVGIETLENTAHNLKRHSDFIEKLGKTNIAIRGSKTINWAKKHSLTAKFVSKDGTMENVLAVLSAEQPKNGKRLFLQAYNQDDVALKQALETIGYSVYLSKPYHYNAPDYKTLSSLRREVLDKSLHAVIFTSKTQVQNLFNESERAAEIVESFNNGVLAAAVGNVTAYELKRRGIVNTFQPNKPKMGAMVVELREYLIQKKLGAKH